MAQVVDTTDFHVGMKIKWEGGIWAIESFSHHKMAQRAMVRAKLRNVETGSAVENSFVPGERFERVVYEEKPAQYSYKDGDDYVFMDLATYDQMPISKEALGDAVKYLVDEMEIKIAFFEGKIMGIELPKSVVLKVMETAPNFKGDTVSGGGKPAVLETGITVTVPVFIEPGENVSVDTRSGQYLERAKK